MTWAKQLAWVLPAIVLASTARAAAPGGGACPVEDPSCLLPAPGVSTAFAARVVGALAEKPLAGDALEKKTEQVAREIRCPVCQGSSIGESPSSTARNMKQEAHDLLAAGFSQEQVILYFEASYGEFVRLTPKATGFTTLIWIMPAVLVLLGLLAIGMFFRRSPARPKPAVEASEKSAAPGDDPSLEPWLRRVRGLADQDEPAPSEETR